MNWLLKGRERLVCNDRFTNSIVMNNTLKEYNMTGLKKKTTTNYRFHHSITDKVKEASMKLIIVDSFNHISPLKYECNYSAIFLYPNFRK